MISIYAFVQRKYTFFLPLIGLLLTSVTFCKTTEDHPPADQVQEVVKQDKEAIQPITKNSQETDKKEEADVHAEPAQEKKAVKKDGRTTNKPKQATKNTEPANQKKSPTKKKNPATRRKGDKAAKNGVASVEVNEAEMLIKQRMNKFVQTEPWRLQIFFRTLAHATFFTVYDELLGGLTDSLENHPSLLDEASIKDLSLFRGSSTKPKYNLVNKTCELIGLNLLPAKLGLVLNFSALNNDKIRINKNRKLVEAFKNHPKPAFAMKSTYQQATPVLNDVIAFLARDYMPFPTTQAVGGLVKFDRDPLMGWMVQLGMIKAETLEKMEVGVGVHKFTKLNIGLLETFSEAEMHLGSIKKIFNTVQSIFNILTFGKSPALEPGDKHLFSLEAPSKRLPYSFVNLFWKRGKAFWNYISGQGGSWYHVFTGGTENSNNLFHSSINNPDWLSLPGVFNLTTGIIAWPYHCIISTSRSIMRLIMLFTETRNMLMYWQKVTIALQGFLKNIAKSYELTVKITNIIKVNPSLEKELSGAILNRIKAFVACEEIEIIMKAIQKMSAKNPTLWEIFWPWNRTALQAFTLYKRLEGMSAESEKLLLEGTVAFSLLHIYQALGTHVYMSEKDLVKDKICLVDIKEQKSPVLSFQRLYTPFTKGEKVLNNFSIGALEADKKQGDITFIDGQNGSGKSTLLMGIAHSLVISNVFEIAFAQKAHTVYLDKLRFLGGASGDMADGKSSFMENVAVMNKSIKEAEAMYKAGEKAVIIGDEFMGGKTIHREAVAIQYPYWKYLQSFPNLLSIIATHDIELFAIAKKEKYYGFEHYTTEYDRHSGKFTYKVKPGSIDKPASIYVLQNMGFPQKLLKETINLLKKDADYPFRHLLPGEESRISINVWIDIFIMLFFVIGGLIIMYRRARLASKEEQTTSSEK